MFARRNGPRDRNETGNEAARTKGGEKLLSASFLMLFFLTLFANCYLSVYYCFEQWLDKLGVAPNWRGVLLGALFGMVMVARPIASIVLLKFNKLPAVLATLLVSTSVLFSYQFLDPQSPSFEWMLLGLRMVQGTSLAIFSACTVSLLVSCIPQGQSARGFALFSLTGLLPYAILPTLGEFLLPIVGSEPRLFAWTCLLVVPCLVMTLLLAPRFRTPEVTGQQSAHFGAYVRGLVKSVTHSGLGLVLLALLAFSLTTQTGIFFMKGLCAVRGYSAGDFFLCYTSTIMFVRVLGNSRLDMLPRYRVVPAVALLLSTSLLLMAFAPETAYIPATILYGASISLMYPLMASVIYNRSTRETRGVNSNAMMTMFDTAGLASPLLGGLVMDMGLGYQAVITAAALMAATSGGLFVADGIRQQGVRQQGVRRQGVRRQD